MVFERRLLVNRFWLFAVDRCEYSDLSLSGIDLCCVLRL